MNGLFLCAKVWHLCKNGTNQMRHCIGRTVTDLATGSGRGSLRKQKAVMLLSGSEAVFMVSNRREARICLYC